ncbi:hypothetical protein NXW48_18190 [Phocaeicola vulgatus]|nr:hypothetical protein [Phocaeicola vulgatus]MCS2507159.1 hypothetical protein [Phocaeicola vulgatus]
MARSSDTRVPACQSRAVIFFPRLHILYRCDDEYRPECRRLNRGSFLLKKEERKKDFLQISWNRLNELLTVKKYRKTVEK